MGAEPAGADRLPRRILMTADAVGGVWRYTVDLTAGLCERGIEVVLAVLGPAPSEEQKREVRAIRGAELRERAYRLEWQQDPWDDVLRSGEWLLELQCEFSPALVHLNGFALAALPWRAPALIVAHSDVYSWWRGVHGAMPPKEWETYHGRVEAGLQACQAIVAPSAAMARALTDDYEFDRGKLSVIHNFAGVAPVCHSRREPFALAAGRLWDPAKNLALLEEIAPQLERPLLVAGGEKISPGNPRAGTLHLLGTLSPAHLQALMERASVFVHPALYEPFGLAVLEAAQRGCCLLLSGLESLRELWEGAARFADPRDPEAWSAHLNELWADEPERARLAEAARIRSRRYAKTEAVMEYSALYSRLIAERERTGHEAAA